MNENYVTLGEYARQSGVTAAAITRRIERGTQEVIEIPFSEIDISVATSPVLRAVAYAKSKGETALRVIDISVNKQEKRTAGRPINEKTKPTNP